MKKHLSRAIRIATAWSCVLLCATGARAGTETLRVVYADWFPYEYSENGKALGFELEIFDAVADRMGIRATYAGYPWKRCLRLIETGAADALVSMMKAPDREPYTDYAMEPISISQSVFFTRADCTIRYDGNLEALKDYPIGLIDGFSYGEAVDGADFLKKDYAPDTAVLVRKLLAGRHQVAAENRTVVSAHVRKLGIADQIRFLNPAIITVDLYVGFSKKNRLQDTAGRFSEALRTFKKTQAYRTILEKYGVTASQLKPAPAVDSP